MPVICITTWQHTVQHLMVTRGTYPILVESLIGTDGLVERALEQALERGIIKKGDRIIVISGIMEGVPGKTNSLKVLTVGESVKNLRL